jgi:hypothetical protein
MTTTAVEFFAPGSQTMQQQESWTLAAQFAPQGALRRYKSVQPLLQQHLF